MTWPKNVSWSLGGIITRCSKKKSCTKNYKLFVQGNQCSGRWTALGIVRVLYEKYDVSEDFIENDTKHSFGHGYWVGMSLLNIVVNS